MLISVYLLQVIGVLPHPSVTALYLAEQVNIHLFGSTARVTNSRVIAGLLINLVGFGTCFMADSLIHRKAVMGLIVTVTYFGSLNLLGQVKSDFEKDDGII